MAAPQSFKDPIMTQEREAVARLILFEGGVFDSDAEIRANQDHRLVQAAYRAADRILALRSGGEGWRLVPVEPTPEMLTAFYETTNRDWGSDIDATCRLTWEAMLDASPSTHGEG